ncbi:MAG: hypothetical protein AAB955_01560 [Patescibacteria group bacterium]
MEAYLEDAYQEGAKIICNYGNHAAEEVRHCESCSGRKWYCSTHFETHQHS